MPYAVYRFGPFKIDTGAHVLLKEGNRLSIQEQPMQVLLALVEEAGQVVTREALRRRLWGTDTFVDFDQSLNSAVRRLRLALEDNSRDPVYIETIPRIGFRFLPEVDVEHEGRKHETHPASSTSSPPAAAAAQKPSPLAAVRAAPARHRRGGPRRTFTHALQTGLLVFALGLVAGIVGAHLPHGMAGPRTGNTNRAPVQASAALLRNGWAAPYVEDAGLEPAGWQESGQEPGLQGTPPDRTELQGWYRLRQRTDPDFLLARQDFEDTLRRHPDRASALVGMGQTDVLLALNGNRSRERLLAARQAAQTALQHQPHMAAAHTLMGAVDALLDWNDAEAEQEFQTALHLDPRDSLAHLWHAVFVLLPARRLSAAEQEARTAVHLEPLSLIAHTDLGWILYSEGKPREALDEYGFVLRLHPGFVPAMFRMHQITGAESRTGLETLPPEPVLTPSAPAQGRVQNLVANSPSSSLQSGPCADEAQDPAAGAGMQLPVLRAAVNDHCPTAYFFSADPKLASLSRDPGFQALLRAVHPAHGPR